MSLGETIKKHRLDKGLSQKKLGDLCDPKIDASNIRRIENGTISPTASTLSRIAKALGVNVINLFDDTLKESHADLNYTQYEIDNLIALSSDPKEIEALQEKKSIQQKEYARLTKMHADVLSTAPLQDKENGVQINAIGVLDLTSDEIQEMLTFKEFLKFKRLNNGK